MLRANADLTYAVLMPWIEGPTWMQVLIEKRELAAEVCLALARALAAVLSRMEQEGLAHCDLSGPNILLPGLAPDSASRAATPLALVDVEQLYGPDLRRPPLLPGGSPGYAHKSAPDGLWGADADRFAGAIVMAEMLAWCDTRVREATWGENYLDPREMQGASDRYRLLAGVLQERWGGSVASLLDRAWQSERLADCATFGEWLMALPERVAGAVKPLPDAGGGSPSGDGSALRALLNLGRRFEEQGRLDSALECYREALASSGVGSPALVEELQLLVRQVQRRGVGAGATKQEQRTTNRHSGRSLTSN